MTLPATRQIHFKVFRDTVHGYIQIPSEWCDEIIDTPIFQRLRCIEQTSMRCLFPSARHDRFVHSLGTYHLGSKAFDSFCENSKEIIDELQITTEQLQQYKNTFQIACLLHDCAHAPFSHIFENHYEKARIPGTDLTVLDQQLIGEMIADHSFSTDRSDCNPKPHEKASAIILLKHYRDQVVKLGGEPELAARMIIGCQYHGTGDGNKRFANVLISLLNGKAIDVDKLDYITRDTLASGIDNTSIDIHRLLSAIMAAKRGSRYVVAFRRPALNVIQQVVDARNYLFRWVFGHHLVQYSQKILIDAVEKSIQAIGGDIEENLTKLFSIESFVNPVEINGFFFQSVTDGDLIYLLKNMQTRVEEAKEWLTRKHTYKAIWKTQAEYDHYFKDLPPDDHVRILAHIERGDLHRLYSDKPFRKCVIRTSGVEIFRNDLFIQVVKGENGLKSYTEVFETGADKHNPDFFYLYRPVGFDAEPKVIVDYLLSGL